MCILCEASTIERVFGSSQNDFFYNHGSNIYYYAGAGNDTIVNVGLGNKIYAGSGNDNVYNYANSNFLDGGSGNDYIYSQSHGSTLVGGEGHDVLFSKGNQVSLSGGIGNDRLYSYGNNTLLDGGDGADFLFNRGDHAVLTGGNGNDRVYSFGDNNQLSGGNGNDVLYLAGDSSRINGGDGDDRAYAIGNENELLGDNGNDVLYARGSNNYLSGGEGNDWLWSTGHNNYSDGGAGDDFIYAYGYGNNTVDGGAGSDRVYAGYGEDTARYDYTGNEQSSDYYHGGSGDDLLSLNFTYQQAQSLAEQSGYSSIDAYINALSNYFNASAYTANFNAFSFDLIASDFEKIEVSVSGEPSLILKAVNDSESLNEEHAELNFSVLGNDLNVDGQTVVSEVNGQAANVDKVIQLNSGATVTLNADGTFSFHNNGAYQSLAKGSYHNEMINYTISNGTNSSTASITIKIIGENDGPSAIDDAFNVSEFSNLTGSLFNDNGLGRDTDIDGDNFFISSVNGQPLQSGDTINLNSGAKLTVNADGSFSYDSFGQFDHLNEGETAMDSFVYQVKDSHGATSEATANITVHGETQDNTPAKLSINDATVTEGNHGQLKILSFEVSLSKSLGHDVSFDFTSAGESASALLNSDFIAQQGSVTIAAGQTSATININVLGDNAYEGNETLNINLMNVLGADLLDGVAKGTIVNNDSQQTGSLDAPILNSNASASKVIYLDFDGGSVTGTAWNAYKGISTINAPAYDRDGNASSFSQSELTNIENIWARVAEDFFPFDVNVTTDKAVYDAANASERLTSMITSNSDWYPNAGGVAYLNVWGRSNDYYQPAWVFSNKLGNGNEKYTAEAISHEIGHNLGLSHDGTSSVGYYSGHGSGDTGWGTIMGVGYYKNLSQWSKGEYNGANNQQDDLAILSSKLGYRDDDFANSIADAALLHLADGFAAEGVIETNTDVDVFKYAANGTVTFDIEGLDKGTNLDILAQLYDASGTLLAEANSSSDLDASLSYTTSGEQEIYLAVSGTGNGDVNGSGYSDYGSLGYYNIAIA